MFTIYSPDLTEAFEKLIGEAEAAVVQTTQGMTMMAFSYVMRYTNQWSGDMVSQWRLTKIGEQPTYSASRWKKASWREFLHEGQIPHHPTSNPNTAAMEAAEQAVQAQVSRFTVEDWYDGVSLVNPHPAAKEILSVGTERFSQPVPLMDAAKGFVESRFAAFASVGSLLRSVRSFKSADSSRFQPKVRKGANDRKLAKSLRAEAVRKNTSKAAQKREERNRQLTAALAKNARETTRRK